MKSYVALLRGINVGRAKRVAMADLRQLLASLGCTDIRTILNSGNAVFRATDSRPQTLAASIETAIQQHFGFPVPVIVHTQNEFEIIVAENVLAQPSRDSSRMMVGFVATPATLDAVRPMLAESWLPDELALGSQAAYLWCDQGVLDSPLMQSYARLTGAATTTRNWATVLKLQASFASDRPSA